MQNRGAKHKKISFSVIIPVINEEEIIDNTIRHIEKIAKTSEIEIIVIDAGKNKSTLKVVKNPLIIKLHSPLGRAVQMNTGAEKASKDILIFLHADTLLPENAFERMKASLNKGIRAGAFKLGIDSKNIMLKIIEFFANLRTSLTKIPYGDQSIFIEKDLFAKLGGFKSVSIMEDIEFMGRVKKNKIKTTIIEDKVLTSARKWKKEGIIKSTSKNLFIRLRYHLGTNPDKLYKMYYSK